MYENYIDSQDGWHALTGVVSGDEVAVRWDPDQMGYLTYEVFDGGYRYVARWAVDGWRLAPKGHETVDYEALLSKDEHADLIALLDKARDAR